MAMFTRWLAGVWHPLAVALVGGWLMFAPALFGTTGGAADSDHLVGALIVTFAIIATAEVGRPIRWINVLLGGWLLAAPWIVTGFSTGARWSDLCSGIAVILLTVPRGAIRGRYGGFTRYLR